METVEKSVALQSEVAKKKENYVPQYAFTWSMFGNEKDSRQMGWWGRVVCNNCLESLRYVLSQLRLRSWAETESADKARG